MAVWNILKDWGLENKAKILCSAANSSNTGRINSAVIFLKQYADREMEYFSRHQLYEKVLRSVFKHGLPQVTISPDVVFFRKHQRKPE
ncbi:hypothetical protein AVEN_201828-1 [Araneus ventricosus]|uniref:Uncharacterized protein n=1 Tax=Araneus ventricosus TaxID=182803 RepID=A0A4Y2J547_ARAVE|nr:hypothetical protein AVEN_38645-1 [Araneus ventricosus]GBM85094.1 hypothetical protein AVEN_201828-1 [Araneus ventricosus]